MIELPGLLERTWARQVAWTSRDAVLYALGISLLDDPRHPAQLRFLQPPGQIAFPAFAASLTRNAAPTIDEIGGRHDAVVLLGERLEIFGTIPAAGSAICESRILGVSDRGTERGAIVAVETRLIDRVPIARTVATLLARKDGGCGAEGTIAPFAALPSRPCDESRRVHVRPDQAQLYALSGDNNPLHLSPESARASGFDGPILHGLCTFAIAARTIHGDRAGQLGLLSGRFTGPVYPGETLRVDLWRLDDAIAFEIYAEERQSRVFADGLTALRQDRNGLQ